MLRAFHRGLTFRGPVLDLPASTLGQGEFQQLNFYRRFPGDYARDTQHLTNEQHGMYCRLLDTLYSTEKPIKTREHAHRIVGCLEHSASIAQCDAVIEEFFSITVEGIWHKRVDEEIKYCDSRRLKASTAAQSRWSRNAPSNATSNAPDMRVPDSRLQTPDIKKDLKTLAHPTPMSDLPGFAIFWECYPKKVGKPAALKAWMRYVKADDRWPDVVAGVETWKVSEQWNDVQFIPYPATFLNQKRWEDKPLEGTNRERTIAKSVRESQELARELGIGNPEMGDSAGRALQPQRAIGAGRKENLH